MTQFTRRHVLGSTVGAAAVLAGCSESESSSGFTRTAVEGGELVVEFEESLEAETISVVDPAGEAFAESEVSAGLSRVTFEISIPYAPGEYRIVAAAGEETIAETTQAIRPELEIVDFGVGANRMDEMPEERGEGRAAQALVVVKNSGSGPESVSKLLLTGDLPNPKNPDEFDTGIYDPEIPGELHEPLEWGVNQERVLFTSTFPFLFEGDGVECSSESQTGEVIVSLQGQIKEEYSQNYQIHYTASESYDGCEISLSKED